MRISTAPTVFVIAVVAVAVATVTSVGCLAGRVTPTDEPDASAADDGGGSPTPVPSTTSTAPECRVSGVPPTGDASTNCQPPVRAPMSGLHDYPCGKCGLPDNEYACDGSGAPAGLEGCLKAVKVGEGNGHYCCPVAECPQVTDLTPLCQGERPVLRQCGFAASLVVSLPATPVRGGCVPDGVANSERFCCPD